MGLKTPEDYRQSVCDGRETYWDGERIEDVSTHPRFAASLAASARDYDYWEAGGIGELRRFLREKLEAGKA